MKKRRWLLSLLVSMIICPLVAVLIFSGWGIYTQRRVMVKAAEDFAKTIAQNLAGEQIVESIPSKPRSGGQRISIYLRKTRSLKMLQSGPPVHGWVAVFDAYGNLIHGSGGSNERPEITRAVRAAIEQRVMQTGTITDPHKPAFALAVCPFPGGRYAAVAMISHYLVPPSMKFVIDAISYHSYVTIAVLCVSVMGVFLLLKYCIWPLRSLSEQVETLEWGKDSLRVASHEPLPEIAEMQEALSDLSERAVDRENMKKRYVNDIISTQEEERRHISQEIHDSPLQTVSALVLRIQLAAKGLSKENPNVPRIREHLAVAEEACMSAKQDLRDACDRLSPPWCSLGAGKTLDEMSTRLSRLHRINVTSSVEGDDSCLDERSVNELCRIVQEAAANSKRHGNASNVWIRLSCSQDEYVLTIEDDGTGINRETDPEALRVSGHRGLAGMKERAESIGGSVTIGNAERGGAIITVTIKRPLENAGD